MTIALTAFAAERPYVRPPAPAAADTLETGAIRLHFLLRPVGWERYALTRDGKSLVLDSDFDFTERGTHVQLGAQLRMAGDLSPERLVAKGRSYRVFSVDTRVDVRDGVATSRTLCDSSTTRLRGPAFAIDGYAPLAAQMMLVRYWLSHGRPASLRIVPGDSTAIVHIARRGRDTLALGTRRVVLDRYSVEGVVWGRESVWLDDRGRLAAVTTLAGGLPFEGVRDEYAAALAQLVDQAIADRMDDLARLRASVAPVASGRFALVGARVIDGSGRAPIEDATVLVEGGRIAAVGSLASMTMPAGTRTIDVHGKTIIPGLWDMHGHVAQIEWGPAYLAAGVTAARDMGGERRFVRAFRDAIDAGRGLGARLLLAGLVDGGGAGAFGVDTAVTLDEARTIVRGYRADRFNQIKIYSLIRPDIVAAITREAHAQGMTVTGHVPNGMTAAQAIDSGMDQLAHLTVRGTNLTSPETQQSIAALVERHVPIDPTTVWNELLGHSQRTPLREIEPRIAMLPHPLASLICTTGTDAEPQAAKARLEQQLAVLKALHDAGLSVVAGTDKGIPALSLPREIELYVAAGFTPLDALRSATSVPAKVMGLDADVGTIEPGKRADLVVLDGNPLENISNVRRVHRVVAGGRMYDPAALWRSVGFRP